MRNWEYKLINEPANLGIATLQRHFDELGRDGWELAGSIGLIFIFKREKRLLTQ